MKANPAASSGWSRKRFWGVAGGLFLIQAALIIVLAERAQQTAQSPPARAGFRLLWHPLTAEQMFKTFFATDPSVFPLPGNYGFSERAWLNMEAPESPVTNEIEPPAWLPLDSTRLGTNFPLMARSDSSLPFGPAGRTDPDLDPWPAFLPTEVIRTDSVCEIQGTVAGRQLQMPAGLPAWPSVQLLSNSVVQIAVNSAGQVVAARLLNRSGEANADNLALDKSRALRFRPVPSSPPVWGRAVFAWETAEATNTSATGAP